MTTDTTRRVPLYGGGNRRSPGVVVGHALVDEQDYERVMAAADPRWRLHSRGYAVTGTPRTGFVLMHRLILGTGALDVDHAHGDRLDNRRCSLRPATRSQNLANQRKTRGTSRFKGVSWDSRTGGWRASIGCHGRGIWLGRHPSQEAAAAAYDAAARRLFGEFARTNG